MELYILSADLVFIIDSQHSTSFTRAAGTTSCLGQLFLFTGNYWVLAS